MVAFRSLDLRCSLFSGPEWFQLPYQTCNVLQRRKRGLTVRCKKSASDGNQEPPSPPGFTDKKNTSMYCSDKSKSNLQSFHIMNISSVALVLWTCDDLIEDWLICLEFLESSSSNAKYVNNALITILKFVSHLVCAFCLTAVPGLALEGTAAAHRKNLCGYSL